MATITEDYVSFETAKLLKEKGFDEKVISFYPPGDIQRPTIQMAMKWLREIHKLDIDVSIEYKNSKKVYYYSILKKTVIRDIDCLHSETNFDSYEQACESAIKFCLKNLI